MPPALDHSVQLKRGWARFPHRALVLRFGLLVLLALALWNPRIPWPGEPVHAVLVLDESQSAAPYFSRSDWLGILEAIGGLPKGSRLSLIRFGADPALELAAVRLDRQILRSLAEEPGLPRRQQIVQTATDTEKALRAALRLDDLGERQLILLVTDGIDTAGDATGILGLAANAGVPVRVLDVRHGKKLRDTWIEDVAAPRRVQPQERFRVTVWAAGDAAREARVTLRVDGTAVAESSLSVLPAQPSHAGFDLTLGTPGDHELEAVIETPDDGIPGNDRYKTLITVTHSAPAIVVTRAAGDPAYARSLAAGGWTVRRTQPAALLDHLAGRSPPALVILDDIAIGDMPARAWAALSEAVAGWGTGLVVLGGPASFSAGAYRHSVLEDLLPVTAEASEPQGRAAVQFLIDKSGSMDRDERNLSRFAYAREAVIQTAKSLEANDLVGLMWFDARPQEALALGVHKNFIAEVRGKWTIRPSGGTVLSPALRRAIESLRGADAEQRLLVLVTDGFIAGDDDLQGIAEDIRTAGIDLISLVIGPNLEIDSLRRLSRLNRGVLLPVGETATLPRLMRGEVERLRNPLRVGPATARVNAPLPFLPDAETWPPLAAYMVTRARPGALVYLQSDNAEPLLAARHVGAARVVALPGGLGEWALAWQDWSRWRDFVGGLADWAAARSEHPLLDLDVRDQPDRLEFMVDALGPNLDWRTGASAVLSVQDPAGGVHAAILQELAPGRYGATVPAAVEGRYRAAVRIGADVVRREVLHASNHEFAPGHRQDTRLSEYIEKGFMKPWTPGSSLATDGAWYGQAALRPVILPVIFVLYILMIAVERIDLGPGSRLRRRLGGLRKIMARAR